MLEIVGYPLGSDACQTYMVRAPQQAVLSTICAQFDPRASVSVSADGYELQLIRQQIVGIPMTKGYLVSWRGDDAAFILANIKLIAPVRRWWQFWKKRQ